MSPQPSIPEPAHAEEDSMLSRKFGKEVANYFSGSPLNRVSFLRSDQVFLSSAIHHSTSSFLLFNDLKPLVKDPITLVRSKFDDIRPLVGEDPFSKSEDELIAAYNSTNTSPQMVFLGLNEREKHGMTYMERYKGAPTWAVDVTPKGSYEEPAKKLIESLENQGLQFLEGRMILSLPAPDAAVYAQARALLDWNARNQFCGGCGQPTLSVNAGGKRLCPPKDFKDVTGPVGSTTTATPSHPFERPPCATRGRISTLSFPRTDPTVIMAVVSNDGQKVLLGRQKRWPQYWYSTLAGFLEPAESIEEAVRREVYEEAGVIVGRVVIHSSQPWPYRKYSCRLVIKKSILLWSRCEISCLRHQFCRHRLAPLPSANFVPAANLMIGAIGQTISGGEKIDLGNDPELEDAKWFRHDEIREALRVGVSGLGEPASPEYKEGNLRLPPATAIANQLVAAIANGFLGGEHKI